jgi:beta-lactamase regulating signal transducer with metallopeptidase domain
MFAARGIAVSFSAFVLVYCSLSIAVCLTWPAISSRVRPHSTRGLAALLLALRIFPFVAAALITAAFTVPSFLLLEPRSIDEPIGGIPLALGICGIALGILGLFNAGRALRQASRIIAQWTQGAQPIECSTPVPVLRMSRAVPAMVATGIARPKVLLSGTAECVLSANELRTALNHEVTHLLRRDNLKKLLFRFLAFPGMAGLEAAWREATEMAADDAAVSNAGEALDLAAALIKLSRLPVGAAVDLTAALVQGPASFMNARVERLISWNEDRRTPVQKRSPVIACAVALATIGVFAVTYSQLLAQVHTATEWLVR